MKTGPCDYEISEVFTENRLVVTGGGELGWIRRDLGLADANHYTENR